MKDIKENDHSLKGFSLASLTEKNSYIKLLESSLKNAVRTGKIDLIKVEVQKVKRIAGVSVRPVEFGFSDGQNVVVFLRAGGTSYLVKINGKDFPLVGDLHPDEDTTFKSAIKQIAMFVVKGSLAFTEKLEAKSTASLSQPTGASGKTPPRNIAQNIKDNNVLIEQLENKVDALIVQRDTLKQQVEQAA